MKPLGIFFTLLGLSLFSLSCGGSLVNEGEDYGDLLGTADGLVLTEDEHQAGWGRSECDLCHNLENIHLTNRTSLNIDIDAIREDVLAEGITGCVTCHGTNGVD